MINNNKKNGMPGEKKPAELLFFQNDPFIAEINLRVET